LNYKSSRSYRITAVKSVMLCGSECKAVDKTIRQRTSVTEVRNLRRNGSGKWSN